MTNKIICPGHPDCNIECPSSGYAHYNDPYGPCITGCDVESSVDKLLKLFEEHPEDLQLSGMLVGVTGSMLARLARKFRDNASSEIVEDIDWLEQLDGTWGDKRFIVEWRNENIGGVLQALAEATGKKRTEAA